MFMEREVDVNTARPPGWSEAPICGYIDQILSNIQASHFHLVPCRRRLEAIDSLFAEVSTGWRNPEDRLGAMLFIRTISAFRVSVALSMSSPVEMYAVLRMCIECAGYAHIMAKNPHLQSVWLRRSESPERAKDCRRAFTPENIKASLKTSDPEMKHIYSLLYDQTILLGAHPNELSVTSAMKFSESEDGETRTEELIMLPEGGASIDVAMITAARVGVCALLIFQHIFPKRYAELSIEGRLAAQQQGL